MDCFKNFIVINASTLIKFHNEAGLLRKGGGGFRVVGGGGGWGGLCYGKSP